MRLLASLYLFLSGFGLLRHVGLPVVLLMSLVSVAHAEPRTYVVKAPLSNDFTVRNTFTCDGEANFVSGNFDSCILAEQMTATVGGRGRYRFALLPSIVATS